MGLRKLLGLKRKPPETSASRRAFLKKSVLAAAWYGAAKKPAGGFLVFHGKKYKASPKAAETRLPERLPHGARTLEVDLSERKMHLKVNGKTVVTFPVAVGKKSRSTPTGRFKLHTPIINPTYSDGKRVIKPGPNNPMGAVKILFKEQGYFFLHGNSNPEEIGKASSLGCVRMYNEHIIWLVDRLPKRGTEIWVRE